MAKISLTKQDQDWSFIHQDHHFAAKKRSAGKWCLLCFRSEMFLHFSALCEWIYLCLLSSDRENCMLKVI